MTATPSQSSDRPHRVAHSAIPGWSSRAMDAAASPARTDGRPTRFVSTTNTRPSRTARTPRHSGLVVMRDLPRRAREDEARVALDDILERHLRRRLGAIRVDVRAARDREQLVEKAACADGVDRRIPHVPEHGRDDRDCAVAARTLAPSVRCMVSITVAALALSPTARPSSRLVRAKSASLSVRSAITRTPAARSCSAATRFSSLA